jgi:hypothetical protein
MKSGNKSFGCSAARTPCYGFRFQAVLRDWLNNPLPQQAERNFLIKLAVNFVPDHLYKPNVRG